MTSRVLVIGGAGFIGSHLTDILIEKYHEVCVYDNFSTGKKEYLPDSPLLTIVEGDILNATLLEKTISAFQPDICYHLAAIHFIPACENHPENAFRINVEGTQTVLSACKNMVEKLVFASTGAIYDPAITEALRENSQISAKDIYGITKWTGEKLIEYYISKEYGKAIIARLFNAVGQRETNPHLIPAILDQMKEGNYRIELGNLFPKRDYVHVQDIADGLYALGLADNAPSQIYNIASGVEHSVEQVINTIGDVIEKQLEVVQVKERMRKYDRPNQLADLNRIAQEIGWKPKRTLKTAITEAWQECRE